MSLSRLERDSTSADWDAKWTSIFDRYQADLRHAYYIRALLKPGENRLLEMAAGSFRDMGLLRRLGINCSGMDFSAESVARAHAAFPDAVDNIIQASAFDLPYSDGFFDVTYHNGFWVLFDDARLLELAAEQARVTRGRMFATVHNAHNAGFVDYFDRMRRDDPLYDIRFFTIDEISRLMGKVCDDVFVVPVGKYKRRHEDYLIRLGLTQPWLIRAYLRASGHRLLDRSERLLCIGTPR